MKKHYALLSLFVAVFFISLLSSREVKASHAAGGELYYEWLHDSTYRLYFKFYRDCTGIPIGSTYTVCYKNSCNTASGSVILDLLPGTGVGNQVSTGCPGVKNKCDSPASIIPGYEEYIYTDTVILPTRCNFYTFYTSVSTRNTSQNLVGQPLFYVEATLDNQAAQGNSNPYFTNKPVPYVCINSPYTFNNGAVDPNNDSLVFEVINPLGSTSTACSMTPSQAPMQTKTPPLVFPGNPFQTNNSFSVNINNGQLSFTPTELGPQTLTVRVKEYRNGALIGSCMRDIQVQVLNCSSVQPTVNTLQNTLIGAQFNNGRVEGCATQSLSFCYDLKSTDTGAVLVVTDNSAIAAPGSITTYTGQLSDSVRGCFNWTPGITDTGLKIITITVKDSNCRPPGILITQTFVLPVYIYPVTQILKDTTICPNDTVQLQAIGGGNFQWTVLPGGSPISSLSCTSCANPLATPALRTQYVVTSNLNSFCNRNKDTVTIDVVTPPQFGAGPDTAICINDSLQLDLNLVPAPGTTYTVDWTPGTYLDDSTSATPITRPLDDITYYIVITPSGIAQCRGFDTINVSVLKGYTIFNSDTAVCEGQSVQVNAIGDPRYTYSWTPTTGVSTPNALNPTLSPTNLGNNTYVVTATYPGCQDSVSDLSIDVQPIPVVTVPADQTLCYGDTLHLSSTVTPAGYPYTYNWAPGGALSDATIPNPVFTATGSQTLTLTVNTPIGCEGTDAITLTVIAADFIEVSNDTAICPGDTAQLSVSGPSLQSFYWVPNVNIDDTMSATPLVWPITSMAYTVIGRDTAFCLDTQDVFVTVVPAATLQLADSARIFPGGSYQMSPAGNAMYYSWQPPVGLSATNISNPVAQPAVNTRYIVNATTEFGCTTVDSIDIFVDPESYLDVPNAFTPGSAPNAILKVVYNGDVQLKSFIIYNRWGVKMFETSNINEGWNGQFNGAIQPMGVYVYTIEATTSTGKNFYKQGNTTLLR